MPGLPIVFFILAAVAILTALSMILSKNAIYSALFLVLNFATVAVLYLILGAPFIALSQITVYAGSIMVLFLFVIMLLGAESLPSRDTLRWQPLIAIPLALILVGDFVYNLFTRASTHLANVSQPPANYGAPAEVGKLLFTQYQLPFEITALILLSAVIGAVILAKKDTPEEGKTARRQDAVVSTQAGAVPAPAKESPAPEQEKVLE
jgi:NADH-quinone oxidoreductase subunit J